MVGELCQVLPEPDADLMPERIMALLGESTHGYLSGLAPPSRRICRKTP